MSCARLPIPCTRAMALLGRLELAFVLLTLSTGAVNLLFGTFHVELFRTAYGLSAVDFAAGHALYAVWNTANDLCSGVVADRLAARAGGSRVPLVRTAGLVWVTAAFLFPWWRWGRFMPLPVQFVAALSLFDGCYSFVAIVEGALLAELARDTAARARIGRLNALGAIVVFPLVSRLGFACWNVDDLRPFQWLACCISFVTACGVALGAALMQQHQQLDQYQQRNHMRASHGVRRGSDMPTAPYGTLSASSNSGGSCVRSCDSCRDLLGPGLGHGNFLRFCCMDALLEAENVFWNAFRLTFANAVLPVAGWSTSQIASLLSVSTHLHAQPPVRSALEIIIHLYTVFAVGTCCTFCTISHPPRTTYHNAMQVIPTASRLTRIALYSVVEKVGVAPVYHKSFVIKISLSLLAWAAVASDDGAGTGRLLRIALPWLFVLGSVVVAAPLGMFAVTISELVDEHRYHTRSAPATTTGGNLVAGRYQSMHALFAKPCNSLGPIIVSLALPSSNDARGYHLRNSANWTGTKPGSDSEGFANATTTGLAFRGDRVSTARTCLLLMIALPLVAGCVQLCVWRTYGLNKARVERIQQALHKNSGEVSA